MQDQFRTLGRRIVDAARLAVAEHLRMELEQYRLRQHEAPGGAGIRLSTDGALPQMNDRPLRSSFFAEGEAA